jgi:hypothetical protein
MLSEKYTTPVKLEIYKNEDKKVTVYRTSKVGTKRIFFFVANEKDQRIGSTLWARKCEVVRLGKNYLRAAN